MALRIGTTNVVRLYLNQRMYVLNNSFSGVTGGVPTDPSNRICSVLNTGVNYDGNIYECQQVNLELLEYKIGTTTVHKRVTVYYHPNGGSGGITSAVKTWGVESIGPFPTLYRTSYYFLGWATTSGATDPNLNPYVLAPNVNTTYYAIWTRLKDVNYMYDASEDPNVQEIIFMAYGEVSNSYDMGQVRQFLLQTLVEDGNPIHIHPLGYTFAIENEGMQTYNIFQVVLGD